MVRELSDFRGRAVSLKLFQQKLKECLDNDSLPGNLYNLCGLKEISGYVVDEKNRDILIIGKVDRTSPPLCLDDFVVALRSAFGKYGRQAPGCSMDYDPPILREINNTREQLAAKKLSTEREELIKKLEKLCASPQHVKVFGVPFNSHFSRVMVQADYNLKQEVDGSDNLNLAFFSSLSDIILGEANNSMKKGRFFPTSAVLNRFWFAPGKNLYLETQNAVFLRNCEVRVETSERDLLSTGIYDDGFCIDPIAEQFADDFSNFYSEIAAQRSIFRELENLYRFVSLAKIIEYKAPHKRVGLSLDYLLETYPLPSEKVQKYITGRSFVKQAVIELKTSGGSRFHNVRLPCCGGISMVLDIRNSFKMDSSGSLAALKENTFNQRFSKELLFYNIDAIPTIVPLSKKPVPIEIKPQKPGFSDLFPKTSEGFWDFIKYAQDNWVYEFDQAGELCQDPKVSFDRLKGDCDDFAVMLAYYTQEYWRFDSYIALIHLKMVNQKSQGHMVAYVSVGKSVKDYLEQSCNKVYPYLKNGNLFYIPLDWMICPDWMWIGHGAAVDTFEWYDIVGKPV